MKSKARTHAVKMRRVGSSMNEIARELRVSKSTVSLWVREVPLTRGAKKRLEALYTKGQIASQKAHRAKTIEKENNARNEAVRILGQIPKQKEIKQLLCAMLYLCEGAKLYANKGHFAFTNSDPALVASFMSLLRQSFLLDESKLRACVHLHGYHKERTQLKFWSKTTSIPIEQFMRSYQKVESGKSIRMGYQGCISIRYYDNVLLRQILAIASEFLKQTGP